MPSDPTSAKQRKELSQASAAPLEAIARIQQLETIFETISDAIMVSDRQGWLVQYNSATNRLFHIDKDYDLTRVDPEEFIRQVVMRNDQGEVISADQWPLYRLVRGEKLGPTGSVEHSMLLPEGEEIYVDCSGSTIRDEQGQIVGAVLVIRNITERHHLEQRVRKAFSGLLELAEALVHLPATEDANNQPIIQVPFQTMGEYLVELTSQMLEYKAASIILIDQQTGKLNPIASVGFIFALQQKYHDRMAELSPRDYLDDEEIARLNANEAIVTEVQPLMIKAQPYRMIIAPMIIDHHLMGVFCAQKSENHAEYTSEEIDLAKATAKLLLLVMERERLQKDWLEAHSRQMALQATNKRFDEFLSIASHELRTPLAGIKGNIQLALRRLKGLQQNEAGSEYEREEKIERIRDYLLHAEHRVNVQNRMISDLLDISRIQANKLELRMGPCDLIKIVSEAVDDQRYSSPDRLITLAQPGAQKIMVNADADRVGQVIHNYLTNAIKYAPADRPIWVAITLEENNKLVRVAVRDEGPGLNLEEQKHIWERFYRAKSIHAQSSTPGLGLGLHICRTIIEAHNGYLGLDSCPGKGSTFWFALPVSEVTLLQTSQAAPAVGQKKRERNH